LTTPRLFLVLAPLTLLAACGGDKAEKDERAASGEVLEGTISDSMLPLDSVRSQAPLAEPRAATRTSAGDTSAADPEDEASDAEPGDEASPAAQAAPDRPSPNPSRTREGDSGQSLQ
jgi:hypothetical protein